MRTYTTKLVALILSGIVTSSIITAGGGIATPDDSVTLEDQSLSAIQDWQIDVNNISYGETVHGIVDTGDKKYRDRTAEAQPIYSGDYHFELIPFTGTAGDKVTINASLPNTEDRSATVTVFSCAKQDDQTKRRCDQHVSEVGTMKSGQPVNLSFRLPSNGTYQIQIGGVKNQVPPQLKYTLTLDSPTANGTVSKVERLQQQLDEKNNTIESLQTQLNQQNQTIESLQTQLEQQNQTIDSLRQRLNESNITDLREQIEQQNQTILRLQQQLHERNETLRRILQILQNETTENETQSRIHVLRRT